MKSVHYLNLSACCFALLLLGTVGPLQASDLDVNGSFEIADDSGLPAGWQMNPSYEEAASYQGSASVVVNDGAKDGTVFLRIKGAPIAGVVFHKAFPNDVRSFHVTGFCRGTGTLYIGFSLWAESHWLRSVFLPNIVVGNSLDWVPIDAVITIPEMASRHSEKTDEASPEEVGRIIPIISVQGGTIDIDALTISPE